MAKIDGLKEEIGWLKIIFGTLIAIDASLIGWLGEHYASASRTLVVIAILAAAVVTSAVVGVNHLAYHRMQQLEGN